MSKKTFTRSLAVTSAISLGVAGMVGIQPAYAAPGDNLALAPTAGSGFNVFLQDNLTVKATINETVINSAFTDDVYWKISGLSGGTNLRIKADTFNVSFTEDGIASGEDRCDVIINYTALAVNTELATSGSIVVDSQAFADATNGGSANKDSADVAECAAELAASGTSGIANATVTLPFDPTTTAAVIIHPGSYVIGAGDDLDAVSGTDFRQDLEIRPADADDDYADGDVTFSLVSWIESDADVETVDANVSKTETVNFYDPKAVSVVSQIERFTATGMTLGQADATVRSSVTAMNDHGQGYLAGTLRFSKTVNLNLVTLSEWEYGVDASNTDDYTSAAIDLRGAETFVKANANFEVLTAAGYGANRNTAGKLYFRGVVDDNALNVGATYRVSFRHTEDGDANVDFFSPGFEVIDNTTGEAVDEVSATVTATENQKQDSLLDLAIDARAGVKTLSYKAQIRYGNETTDALDYTAYEAANVPVAAVVTAGSFLPTGTTITVGGSAGSITVAGGSLISTGLTDSKGNWTVSVTSDAAAGQSYTVEFYVLGADGVWDNALRDTVNNTGIAPDYVVTHVAATATTLSTSAEVLASDKPAVTFTIKDQWGSAISQSSTGRAYSIQFLASSKTNLEKYAAVTNGVASFDFTNWLKTGESDVLTATVFTGTSTAPSLTSVSKIVNLYAPVAATAVNVVTEVTGVTVTYDDFITGAATSTNVATDDAATVYTGTVVDSFGAGIPGVAVKISGKGFQFQQTGGNYFVDEITVTTTTAGTFTVNMWTNVASATGNVLTVAAGGKTATTKVKSAIPVDANGTDGSTGLLSAANLRFTWNVPSVLVMNTTYAITASVTDKWGNPVRNASITFNGYGAAQFNGGNTATRATAANGQVTVYLRSLKDVDGPSAIGANLTDIDQDADSKSDSDNLAATLTDATGTKWDESKWTNSLETQVNFLKSGSGAATGAGVVNVGSFNGKLVVYAQNLDGKRISWKVGGNWGRATAVGNTLNRFDRPTPRRGVTVSVQIYVDGVLTLTKSVVTR